jgi:hypothetical protein
MLFFRKLSLLPFVLFLMTCVLPPVTANAGDAIPGWLVKDNSAGLEFGGNADKRVWLVLGKKGDRPLDDVQVLAMPVFITSGSRRHYLYDQRFEFVEDKERFVFGREDIDFIRYYTRVYFSLNGPACWYGYRPRIVLKNGEILKGEPERISPKEALRPGQFKYETVHVVEFYGKRKERTEVAALSRPVLALAWSREKALEAKEQIIVRFARKETNRMHIKWGDRVKVYTAAGPVTVEPHAYYDVRNEGGYSSWIEKTKGTVEIEIDGRKQVWDFSNTCRDMINTSQCRGCVTCRSHVRVKAWKKDGSGTFNKLHFGSRGVNVFYRTGNSPEGAAEVDPSVINVGFNLRQE